jgi:hypothetical protein
MSGLSQLTKPEDRTMTPTAHRLPKPRTRGCADGGEGRAGAPEPKVYVLKDGWLDVLAGDDPSLRTRGGRPMASVISALAGLDRTHLGQVDSRRLALSLKVMEALITFLEARRGMTEEQARAALFDYVTQSEAAKRARQAVAA